MILEDKLKASQRSKRSFSKQLGRTEENMWAIIEQSKIKIVRKINNAYKIQCLKAIIY